MPAHTKTRKMAGPLALLTLSVVGANTTWHDMKVVPRSIALLTPPCLVSTGMHSFDLSELRSLHYVSDKPESRGWVYSFSACGAAASSHVGPSCAAIPHAAVLEQTRGECISLGDANMRSITKRVNGVSLVFEGGRDGRSSVVSVECADIARPRILHWAYGVKPGSYDILVQSRAGCAVACGRDLNGAVCGSTSKGNCVIDDAGGHCVCAESHSGVSCADTPPSQPTHPRETSTLFGLLLFLLLSSLLLLRFLLEQFSCCKQQRPGSQALTPGRLLFAVVLLAAMSAALQTVLRTSSSDTPASHHSTAKRSRAFKRDKIGNISNLLEEQVWGRFQSCLLLSSPPCSPVDSGALLHTIPSFKEFEHHFNEVQDLFAPFRSVEVHSYAGFSGPWIENVWINRFSSEDAQFWYPIVPLFAQWTDAAFGPSLNRDTGLRERLDRIAADFFWVDDGPSPTPPATGGLRARRDMMYLTVVQHDDGVPWRSVTGCEAYRNVFVLGVSSWGSAAIPYAFLPPPPESPKPARRKLAASFVGTLNVYRRHLPDLLTNSSLPPGTWHVTQASRDEMFEISANSLFALAPRSYGRTSIRLTELLQCGGTVVLYIFGNGDVPWMPYASHSDVWGVDGMAFAIHWSELSAFFCAACELLGMVTPRQWAQLMQSHDAVGGQGKCACPRERWQVLFRDSGIVVPSNSTLAAMEQRSRTLGPTLFSPDGAVEQIRRLAKGPGGGESASAFGCVPKPDTLRVPWQYHWNTAADFDTFGMLRTLFVNLECFVSLSLCLNCPQPLSVVASSQNLDPHSRLWTTSRPSYMSRSSSCRYQPSSPGQD